jgi:hypothetical protein
LLLCLLLQTARDSGVAALSWAVCIVVQVVLTGLAATILELSLSYNRAAARSRFNLQYLFIWTTLLATALGGAGIVVSRFGFKLADVADWEFFTQLQTVAVIGAGLATAVYVSVRWPRLRSSRGLACAVVITAGTILAPILLSAVFGDKVGAPWADLVWLFGGQCLFLLTTLISFQVAD